MLNITLIYFFLFGLYHLGRKYLPKIHIFLRGSYHIFKEYPLMVMVCALSTFIAMHTQQSSNKENLLSLALIEDKAIKLRHLDNLLDAVDIEKLLFRLLTFLWSRSTHANNSNLFTLIDFLHKHHRVVSLHWILLPHNLALHLKRFQPFQHWIAWECLVSSYVIVKVGLRKLIISLSLLVSYNWVFF